MRSDLHFFSRRLVQRVLGAAGICVFSFTGRGQDLIPEAKHAAIVFPYPMYKEKWRTSLGVSILVTPEDITEEVQVPVPAIDFHVLRRVSDHFQLEGRIDAQVIQNQFRAGFRYVLPLSGRFFLGAGAEAGYWFGFLNIEGFNSKASGWMAYPNISFGWRSSKDLLVTVRAQSSENLFYKAYNGKVSVSTERAFYNGETFSLSLEQAFYHHHHLTLAFSAIYNYFYWQTWSLFYRVDRKIYYPQITVGFIL